MSENYNLELYRTSSYLSHSTTEKIIERQILELEEKRKKNLRMLKKKDRKRGRPAKKSELERDVILHLSPVRSSGTHSNRAPSTIAEMSDDFYSID